MRDAELDGRRSTARAAAGSAGGPETPGQASCIAPNYSAFIPYPGDHDGANPPSNHAVCTDLQALPR